MYLADAFMQSDLCWESNPWWPWHCECHVLLFELNAHFHTKFTYWDGSEADLSMHSCVFFVHCSFGMAYDFIDCIGDDVDVVSDSEVGPFFFIWHDKWLNSSGFLEYLVLIGWSQHMHFSLGLALSVKLGAYILNCLFITFLFILNLNRTSRSCWRSPTVNLMSAWLFTESAARCC